MSNEGRQVSLQCRALLQQPWLSDAHRSPRVFSIALSHSSSQLGHSFESNWHSCSANACVKSATGPSKQIGRARMCQASVGGQDARRVVRIICTGDVAGGRAQSCLYAEREQIDL